MTRYERVKIDTGLKQFVLQNFERPEACRNLEQVRFYIRELCLKIEQLQNEFTYVPEAAYSLLTQYNGIQNRLLPKEQNTLS